jgi:NAD(P)-dependent dehydrogenase (short-subunit alcohol dehydrogenase family)
MSSKKTVLITGCSSGIGLATVQQLLAQNYRVIATARQPAALQQLTAMGAVAVALDLDQPASIQACVEQVQAQTTELYALINNAAYAQPGSVQELTTDVLQKQFQTNVFGTIDLTSRFLPLLQQSNSARIICISSILGVVSAPYLGAYCASKYALEAFISSLRMELVDTAIDVVSIRPGAIETAFRKRAVSELKAGVVVENSQHKDRYQKTIDDLEQGRVKYTRAAPDEAARLILRTLAVRKPKVAYYLTRPAKLMGFLRRLLSQRQVEAIMRKHG